MIVISLSTIFSELDMLASISAGNNVIEEHVKVMHISDSVEYLLDNPDAIRLTVSIEATGRSGSILLSNLFDGHPEVLSVPPYALSFYFEEFSEFLKMMDDNHLEISSNDVCIFIVKTFPYLFSETDHCTPGSTVHSDTCPVGVHVEYFKKYFSRCIDSLSTRDEVSIGNVFKAIHVAYAAAIGRNITARNPIIVWQRHFIYGTITESQVSALVGNMVFFITVRLPHVSTNQLFRHACTAPIKQDGGDYGFSCSGVLYSQVSGANRGKRPYPTFVIRFEDMHSRTEQLMRSLASYLGLIFDPILLETTLDGKPFYFSVRGMSVTGTSPDIIFRQRSSSVNALDAAKIRYAMSRYYRAWNYYDGKNAFDVIYRINVIRKLFSFIPMGIELRKFTRDLMFISRRFLRDRRRVVEMLNTIRNDSSGPVELFPINGGHSHSSETSCADKPIK
ncbi:MAG: hypothetical protein H7840_12915 [Alphaproteobacteria bacterium]